MLCAMVNNNVRCYNESMEFAERVEDTLDDDHKVHFGITVCMLTGLSTRSNSGVWLLTGLHLPCIKMENFCHSCKTCGQIFLA